MRKVLEKLALLTMAVIASYQVAAGVSKFSSWAVFYYTLSFGVLVVAGLLLLIFGFEILKNPAVVIVATLIPLGIFMGLVYPFFPKYHICCLAFSILGILLIAATRGTGRLWKTLALALVHGMAGLFIFFLPIFIYLKGEASVKILWMSLGAAIIGGGGILLASLQLKKPLLPQRTVFLLLPWVLLFMVITLSLGLNAL